MGQTNPYGFCTLHSSVSHEVGWLGDAESGVGVALQGGRAEVHMLIDGVEIPEASLQRVRGVHRSAPVKSNAASTT